MEVHKDVDINGHNIHWSPWFLNELFLKYFWFKFYFSSSIRVSRKQRFFFCFWFCFTSQFRIAIDLLIFLLILEFSEFFSEFYSDFYSDFYEILIIFCFLFSNFVLTFFLIFLIFLKFIFWCLCLFLEDIENRPKIG